MEKDLNCNITYHDVEIFDSRRSQAVVQGLVDNFTLSSMDLIIGPAASSNVKIVAEQVTAPDG